tara:strand:+ start:1387 stop:1914 length:528 start_codon:yes stop_codon:yes gene_type:complete
MSSLRLLNETTASAVTSVSITDVFTSDFDIYKIVIKEFYQTGTTTRNLQFRFINSAGSVISSNDYENAVASMNSFGTTDELRSTSADGIENYFFDTEDEEQGAGGVFYIFTPTNSSLYTFFIGEGVNFNDGNGATTYKGIGVLQKAVSVKGINFVISGDTIERFKVSVYGLRVDS